MESSYKAGGRLATVTFASLAGALCAVVLVLSAAPAFAAAPETPETVSPATSVTATTATLEGVLNPGAAGQPGSYQFSYAPSESDECTPGTFDPESPALANGAMKETESVSLTGLEPDKEYVFCIIAYSLSAEPAQGAAVAFKTLAAKPTIDAESASVASTAATLAAQVNPNNQETTFVVEYATKEKAGALEGTIVKLGGSGPLPGFGDQTATVPEIEGLTPGKSYFYRVVASNATGTTDGTVKEFATAPTPHTEAVTAATATTATFHGTLTPLNASVSAEYAFEYNIGTEPTCTGESSTGTASAGTGSGTKSVSSGASGLQPSTIYSVCLVASNAFGAEADTTPVTFKTLAAPPKVDGESTADVTPFEATLEAQVNANNQVTNYSFEYAANPGLSGAITLTGAGPLSGYGDQAASVSTGHVLTPGTTYYYRVTAENEAHEIVEGAVEEFIAPPATAPGIEGESSAGIGTEGATLEAVIDPDYQETTCKFEYATSESAIGTPGAVALPCSAALGSGGPGAATSVALSGLTPATTYYFRVLTTNTTGQEAGNIEEFETLAAFAPTIVGESVSGVEATTARLEAEVDSGGAATTYSFQYGPGESYEQSTTETELPASGKASATLTGLTPGETYRYRVVATNVESPAGRSGLDKAFTTTEAATGSTEACANAQLRVEQPFGQDLPDCRAYEMVSPLETNGQDATEPFVASPPRAALGGGAVTYSSRGSFEEPTGATLENQYLSRRTPNGWTTRAITPLRDPTKAESRAAYAAAVFTPELTAAIAATNDPLTGVGSAGEFQLFRVDLQSGGYQRVGVQEEGIPMGASSDLTHVVLQAPEGTEDSFIQEWVNGAVTPVNVTNTGTEIQASVGAVPHVHAEEDLWHAVSSDGSRVYFTSQEQETGPGTAQLYVRVNAEQPQSPMSGESCEVASDACTIEVSTSQRSAPDPHGVQPARYWGASADGSKVFFTSDSELTEDAYTGPEENMANLYEYELSGEPGKTLGRLTDLTVDEAENGAAVQGVVQISEGGSYIYFIAEGVLAEGATAGEPNLYVVHEGDAPKLVATLAPGDEPVWQFGATVGQSGPELNSAVVSPSGGYLAFLSEKNLTGYDNREAAAGDCNHEKDNFKEMNGRETGLCNEVYLYDAAAGKLACASCDPTGALPAGPASFGPLLDRKPFDQYRSRNLLEDGTLFFDSFDALVPDAAYGIQNVYEYEDGQARPISDPNGGHESFFLDASAKGPNPEEGEGTDVFFATADQLLPQDKSENVVVYDARVDGGFPTPSATTPCNSGETCEPPASLQPPLFGAPLSGTFSGPGNMVPLPTVTPAKKTAAQVRAEKLAKALKACRKDKSKQKRAACERTARGKYGAKKAKKKAKHAKKAARVSQYGRASR